MPRASYHLTADEAAVLHRWAEAFAGAHPIPDGISGLAEVLGVTRQQLSPFLNRSRPLGLPTYKRLLALLACYWPVTYQDLNRTASEQTRALMADISAVVAAQALRCPGLPGAILRGLGVEPLPDTMTPPGVITASVPL